MFANSFEISNSLFLIILKIQAVKVSTVSTRSLTAETLFDVKGNVCVVTGGGTGIGLMATQALAANGAIVYITGRCMEALENAAKTHQPSNGVGKIIPIGPCDVTKKDSLQDLISQISKKEKYIDLLVTNAGISGPKAEPDSESASELKEKLFENEEFSEWSDTFNTNDATVHLSKLMSYEFKRAGIRVNSIAPGYFPSEMTAKESDKNQKSELPEEKIGGGGSCADGEGGE
ncbi:hypothetical protein B0J14DRAFT_626647 [Halenospora varia]|nr:hypothetical protein B0J14DRAFT_626647 [Halenospora varia]